MPGVSRQLRIGGDASASSARDRVHLHCYPFVSFASQILPPPPAQRPIDPSAPFVCLSNFLAFDIQKVRKSFKADMMEEVPVQELSELVTCIKQEKAHEGIAKNQVHGKKMSKEKIGGEHHPPPPFF